LTMRWALSMWTLRPRVGRGQDDHFEPKPVDQSLLRQSEAAIRRLTLSSWCNVEWQVRDVIVASNDRV